MAGARPEGAIIRGAAIGAFKELETAKSRKPAEHIRQVMSSIELSVALRNLSELCIVFISAKNCKACKKVEKTFQSCAMEHLSGVDFLRMDMDSNRSTWRFCKENGVTHTPTFLFYRSGAIADSLATTQPEILEKKVIEFCATKLADALH